MDTKDTWDSKSEDFEGTGMSEEDIRHLTVEEMEKMGIYDSDESE